MMILHKSSLAILLFAASSAPVNAQCITLIDSSCFDWFTPTDCSDTDCENQGTWLNPVYRCPQGTVETFVYDDDYKSAEDLDPWDATIEDGTDHEDDFQVTCEQQVYCDYTTKCLSGDGYKCQSSGTWVPNTAGGVYSQKVTGHCDPCDYYPESPFCNPHN